MKFVGYVFGGPSDNCRVLEYRFGEARGISDIHRFVSDFQEDYPGKTVVVVDGRSEVRVAFMNAKKEGSFTAWMEFYDYVVNKDAIVI